MAHDTEDDIDLIVRNIMYEVKKELRMGCGLLLADKEEVLRRIITKCEIGAETAMLEMAKEKKYMAFDKWTREDDYVQTG